jgi:hypothetical protein
MLAMDIFDGTQTDVWTYDWMRDTLSRLTFDGADDQRPSGRPTVIASRSHPTRRQGRSQPVLATCGWHGRCSAADRQQAAQIPGTFHPNGKFLAYSETNYQGDGDILILPIEGDEASGFKPGTPTVFLRTPFNEGSPMFSPDGSWIAYISSESGRNEIYVRPFPGPGGKWQISAEAGDDPTWSRVRTELLFANGNTLQLMGVVVRPQPASPSAPTSRACGLPRRSRAAAPAEPRSGLASRWAALCDCAHRSLGFGCQKRPRRTGAELLQRAQSRGAAEAVARFAVNSHPKLQFPYRTGDDVWAWKLGVGVTTRRYDRDEIMRAAIEQAQLGLAAGEVPIGAVLVVHDEIVSRAFNQPIGSVDPTAHCRDPRAARRRAPAWETID